MPKFKPINNISTAIPASVTFIPGTNSGCKAMLDVTSYLWTWGGANQFGQLGNGLKDVPSSSPVSVVGGRQWSKVSLDQNTFLALDLSGYAWGWGQNAWGSIGVNTTNWYSSPVSVLGGRQWRDISLLTTYGAVGIDVNGYAWQWGAILYNFANVTYISSPISVLGGYRFSTLSNKNTYTPSIPIALDFNSYAYAWGTTFPGNNTTIVASSSPLSVNNMQWKSMVSGFAGNIGINSSDYAWSWGTNQYGQLGTGNNSNYSAPTSVLIGSKVSKVWYWGNYNAGALDVNSYAYLWGEGSSGQLANGGIFSYSWPAGGYLAGRRFLHLDNSATAVDENRYIWVWGASSNLGDGQFVNSTSPVSLAYSYGGGSKLRASGATTTAINLVIADSQYFWEWSANIPVTKLVPFGSTLSTPSPIF